MRVRRAWLLLAALLLLAAIVGITDADAAGWLPAVVIAPAPPSGTAGQPGVVTDPHGDEMISWQDIAPDGENCAAEYVSSRVSGGDFVTSSIGCGVNTNAWLSPAGIVYYDGRDNSGGFGEAHAPAGQPLPTTLTHVSSPVGNTNDTLSFYDLGLQFDAAGHPTFFYVTEDASIGPPATWVLSTATQDAGGNWVSQTLSEPDDTATSWNFQVAPDGSALALWPYGGALEYSRRAAGATSWSAPAAMPTDSYGAQQLAVDPQSRFTLLYQTGSYPNAGMSARTMSTAGTWTDAQTLAMQPGYSSNAWQLATDPSGNAAVAVWEVANDVNVNPCYFPDSLNAVPCGRLRAFSRAAGGTAWTDDGDDLYGPTAYYYSALKLNVDPQDNATIELDLRENPASNTTTPFYFTRAAGAATFAASSAPSTPPGSTSPTLSVDPNGYTIATWVDGSGNVVSSVYDAVPPAIDSVTTPSDAVAGSPASFDVTGSDVWGPLSFSVDFGDGQLATGRTLSRLSGFGLRAKTTATTIQHTYAQPGAYNATISVTDGAANTTTTSRSVNVGAAPQATGSGPSAGGPLPPVPGLPDPVLGKTANVFPVKPVVLIKTPGARKFVPLTKALQIKMGSLIDARHGRVRVTVADGKGGFSTADFYEGLFQLVQKTTGSRFASALLSGGRFTGCPRAPKAQLSRKRAKPSRSIRHLWASGSGSFRTAGRFSSATIRGTTWKTDDRCNGTLTLVTKGKVAVRDFVKRKTVVVKAGHRYLAGPKKE